VVTIKERRLAARIEFLEERLVAVYRSAEADREILSDLVAALGKSTARWTELRRRLGDGSRCRMEGGLAAQWLVPGPINAVAAHRVLRIMDELESEE
jgi:hypothetical protein